MENDSAVAEGRSEAAAEDINKEVNGAPDATTGGQVAEAPKIEAGESAEEAKREAAVEESGGKGTKHGEIDLDSLMGEEVRFHKDIEDFLISLHEEMYDRNIESIRKLYEIDFNQVTEKHFCESRWPSVEKVSQFYSCINRFHPLIVTLYRELYYRHVFAKCTESLTWEDRKQAWTNYSMLLQHFVDDECASTDTGTSKSWLPAQWLWDMLDEFVYQYQDTCRWRMRLGRKGPDDPKEKQELLKSMKEDCEYWKGASVLEFLHLLVERSDVKEFMKRNKEEFARSHSSDIKLKYQLGYFSMICLLRVHVLMGNYHLGVQMVADMELSTRSLYWKAPACHITVFYNLGFAYMMMRRYLDAIRHMSQFLIFVSKQRGYLSSQSYQQAAMTKLTDRMFFLVMMCSALCNSRLDEAISTIIKDKYPDKYYKLQQDDEETYRDMFVRACPKFINPVIPSYETFEELEKLAAIQDEPLQRQLNIFLKEVRYLKNVSNIRSFAKLYNNIQLQKLASLMEIKDKDAEETVRSQMLCVKRKSRQQVWRTGSLLSGDFLPTAADVEFYLDHDMLHVKSSKSHTVYMEYFLKQMDRCQDLLQTIQRGDMGGLSSAAFGGEPGFGASKAGNRGSYGDRNAGREQQQQTVSVNSNADRMMALA
eukprot:GHVQ01031577.1.p1 GENE.GHVQ01031577.1~~GHVQ01031577.1.p1  ORF type:complete len:650 (+),score=87.31 GHVQ01031577.1:117-2066(+)